MNTMCDNELFKLLIRVCDDKSTLDLRSVTVENEFVVDDDLIDRDSEQSCAHNTVEFDGYSDICADCGIILQSHYLSSATAHSTAKPRYQKPTTTIISEIPSFVSQDIKNLTVELYGIVTREKIFRNVFRKAIILACLHRASIIKRKPIYFDEMIELFELKTHDANRGISYVSTYLPRTLSDYAIPYCDDESCTMSIVNALNISDDKSIRDINVIIQYINRNSDVMNNSHSKSAICGCIYHYLSNRNITIKYFASKCKLAEMTIVKKYITIKRILIRSIAKRYLSRLLSKYAAVIDRTTISVVDDNNGHDFDGLYSPSERCVVREYDDERSVSITSDDGSFIYPIDEVDDILEWNLFYTNRYYDRSGRCYALNVELFESAKDIDVRTVDADDKVIFDRLLDEIPDILSDCD